MKPKPIPPLNEEQWQAVEKEANRPANAKDEERYQRATQRFLNCPLEQQP